MTTTPEVLRDLSIEFQGWTRTSANLRFLSATVQGLRLTPLMICSLVCMPFYIQIYIYMYTAYIYIYTDIDWLRISSINRKAKFWKQLSENPTTSLDVWNLQLGWSHGLCFSMADWCLSHIFDFKPGFNAGENRKWFLPWLESKENF